MRLPEDEDPEVALVVLRFLPSPNEGGGWAPPLPLEEIPEVLLHEAIADAREIAGGGTFDQDWEARIR